MCVCAVCHSWTDTECEMDYTVHKQVHSKPFAIIPPTNYKYHHKKPLRSTTPPVPKDTDAPARPGVLEWSSLAGKLDAHEKEEVSPCNQTPEQDEEVKTADSATLVETQDSACLTEVCNSANLPEVEILSLIEEQIPKYRLRADTITDFIGYNNEDWIQTPLIPLDEDLELSDDQINETLKYFVLCSERVTQMTKTYNDIEAVNRLLEEKERDLELAAKIGQTLLTKNQEISEKNDNLEEQLSVVTEKVNQLKHEILMKDGLLQAFTENVDLSPSDESSIDSVDGLHASGASALHKKVKNLEDENIKLRFETAQLSAETSDYEEKEQRLVDDCLSQLGSIKHDLECCSEELMKKTEECGMQKEEITGLLAQLVELQKRVKVTTAVNMELQQHLLASQDSQRKLTKELSELKDKQDELAALYEEAQEEIRDLRRKQKPGAVRHSYMSSSMMNIPTDSLASELESSLKGDIDYPRGYSPSERKVHNWKVFETAKAVRKSGSCRSSIAGSRSSIPSAYGSFMHLAPPSNMSSHNTSQNDSGDSAPMSNRSSMYFSDVESVQSDAQSEGYNADLDSLYSTSTQIGRPGIPGSNDLETALRKLSLRRANELNEQDFKEEEKQRARQNEFDSDMGDTPGTCLTPDSTLSTGSGLSQFSLTGSNNPYYRLPQKLKIVKPLEGSVTLRQWQQLATPNMEGVFETRPGVQTKGERKLDTEVETYNISDIEEDDDYSEIPGKRYENSRTINTFTNSMVRHPTQHANSDDEDDLDSHYDLSDSSGTPQMSSPRMATSVQRGNQATSTYSMSLGLAAILNERDLGSSGEQKSSVSLPSNPARVSSIVSDSHFNVSKSKMASVYTTTSSSEVRTATVVPQMRAEKNEAQGEKTQGPNILIDRLKNTGVSLYGYLGNWGKSSNTPGIANIATEASGQIPNSAGASGSVTAYSHSETTNIGKSKVSGILSRASTGGVLGALTSLRQNGLL